MRHGRVCEETGDMEKCMWTGRAYNKKNIGGETKEHGKRKLKIRERMEA
jgi:hypothetical protein